MWEYKSASKGLGLMALGAIVASLGDIRAVNNILGYITAIAGTALVLYGLYIAMPAHAYYKLAMFLESAVVVLSVLSRAFGGRIISGTLFIVGALIGLLSTVLICGATGALLKEKSDDAALIDQSKLIVLIYAACAGASILCTLLSWIPILNMLTNPITDAVIGVVMLVANVLKAVFYYRASRALKA